MLCMERLSKFPQKKKLEASENKPDIETLKSQLRAHIRDNVIRLKELREKAS